MCAIVHAWTEGAWFSSPPPWCLEQLVKLIHCYRTAQHSLRRIHYWIHNIISDKNCWMSTTSNLSKRHTHTHLQNQLEWCRKYVKATANSMEYVSINVYLWSNCSRKWILQTSKHEPSLLWLCGLLKQDTWLNPSDTLISSAETRLNNSHCPLLHAYVTLVQYAAVANM